MKNVKHRLPAAVLAFLLACMLPVTAYADYSEYVIIPFADTPQTAEIKPYYDPEVTGTSYLEDMEKQSITKPSGYDEDTLTPYGTGQGEVFTMLENTELFYYASSNLNKKTSEQHFISQFGQGNTGSFGNLSLSDVSISWLSKTNKDKVWSYTQGVSFDPTGCGRRNYIGLVGYEYSSHTVKVSVINTQTKNRVAELTVASGDECAWIEQCKDKSKTGLDTVDSRNFFQITAGDYNGDGCDSLVVWCGCLSENRYTMGDKSFLKSINVLTEITRSKDASWNAASISATRTGGYMNSEYLQQVDNNYPDTHISTKTSDLGQRMGAALETGDVNGDGIDDLAVVSYGGKNANAMDRSSWVPKLSVGFGKKGAGSIADLSIKTEAVGSTSGTMTAPGISIGDLDGDGQNEIAVAGFAQISGAPLGHGARFAWFKCRKDDNGNTSLGMMGDAAELSTVSPISEGDSVRKQESCWQQFSVECVAFDGMNSKEYLFLNGYFYLMNSGGAPERKDTCTYFNSLRTNAEGIKDVNENFIYSAAVGNFFSDNKTGREQIVMTVGYKENNADDYSFRRIVVGKNGTSWTMTGTDKNWYIVNNGDTFDEKLNCIVVAMDNDYDSVVGKLSAKTFAYTDPNVVAVLQAAPRFEEFDAGNSSTTYSYTESFTKTTTTGSENSYNFGIAVEEEAGPLKVAMDAGCAFEVEEEYSSSRTTEYTTTFEANDENQVIVRRTLLYFYSYDIMGSDGKFRKNALMITAPQYPVMTSMSMDQYNEFAKAYNDKYANGAKISQNGSGALVSADQDKLDIITDQLKGKYYLNNEGDPYGYASNSTKYKYGKDLCKDGWMNLSHAGGTTQEEFTASVEDSYTTTTRDGIYVNMSVMAGAGSDLLKVSAYAGFSVSCESLRSRGASTAKMTATSTGGAVQNLDDESRGYNFRWKLIGWKSEGDLFGKNIAADPASGVLFVGYAVDGISAPVQPVTDLTAEYTPSAGSGKYGTVTLTWTSPVIGNQRGQIGSFRIYRTDQTGANGNYPIVKEVVNAGAGKAMTYTVSLDSGYTGRNTGFVIRSAPENDSGLWSIYSNEVSCDFTMTDAEIYSLIDNASADLQQKMAELDTVDQTALNQALSNLTSAYSSADQALAAALENKSMEGDKELDAKITELQNRLTEAQTQLQDSITAVQIGLSQAVSDLNDTIAKGDQANAQELLERANALTEAYKAADQVLLNTANEAVKSARTELQNEMNAANTALQSAVDKVQQDLENTTKDLNAAIAEGDAANKEELEKAIAQLSETYREADDLLQALSEKLETITTAVYEIKFGDVSEEKFYYHPVLWAVRNGITSGTTATTFSPDNACTRSQMVTFLWKMAGSPEVSGSLPFTDVKKSDFYYSAVLWALQKGITSGTTAATFSPGKACTRGQMAVFLMNMSGGASGSRTDSGFTDVNPSAYYAKAVVWLKNTNITAGTTADTFSPDKACTRGQMVTFLWKYSRLV